MTSEHEIYNIFYRTLIEKYDYGWATAVADELGERYRFYVLILLDGEESVEIYPFAPADSEYKICFKSIKPIGRIDLPCIKFFRYLKEEGVEDSLFSEAFDEVIEKYYPEIIKTAEKYGYDPEEFWGDIFPDNPQQYDEADELKTKIEKEINDLYYKYVVESLIEKIVDTLPQQGIEVEKREK
ncbi:MAG: hypothetical protein Q6363_009780 [Candidatus Njordarchaeota archaeon]